MKRIVAVLTPVLLTAEVATAQVVISEVCPEPPAGQDVAEWIELHNLGEDRVSLGGQALSDHLDGGDESPVRWTFGADARLSPGEVIVVARQARAFAAAFGRPADYELADGEDDPAVPNLTPFNGVDVLRLSSRRSGDAVVLRDPDGAIVDAVEWGTLDRAVPGIPLSDVAGAGESFVRVRRSGSSQVDFVVTDQPSPGTGFVPPLGPDIGAPRLSPPHLDHAGPLAIEARVADPDGLAAVEIALATATSSRGEASTLYVPMAMARGGSETYRFAGVVAELAPSLSFPEPATFHERYLRFFVYAEDELGNVRTDPAEANEWSTNVAYHQRNVLPAAPSPWSEVRASDASGRVSWVQHSARVRGVAITALGVVSEDPRDFAIQGPEALGLRAVISTSTRGSDAVSIRPGDVVEVVGEIEQSHGVTRLGEATVQVMGKAPVTTATVTVAELLSDPERFESRLVTVLDARIASGTVWGGADVTLADATGALAVRVFEGSGLAGATVPEVRFHLRGVFGQRTETEEGTQGGYFLTPRGAEDVVLQASGGTDTDGDGMLDQPGDSSGRAGPGALADEDCSCDATRPSRATRASAAFWVGLGLIALARRRLISRSPLTRVWARPTEE